MLVFPTSQRPFAKDWIRWGLVACLCMFVFPTSYIHSRLLQKNGVHMKGQYVHACNLYMFVFIYPLETFLQRNWVRMKGHSVHVYIWRGTRCMSTANYDPERMQPMLLDTVHTCALILQIFKENIYIYLRFVCNYLQIITQRILPGGVGVHMCLAFRNI